MRPEWRRRLSWQGVGHAGALLMYQLARFVLIAVFSFPVALIYAITALLLNPSIPETARHRLPELIIDRFDQIFQYGVTLAVLLAIAVTVVLLLKNMKNRFVGVRND